MMKCWVLFTSLFFCMQVLGAEWAKDPVVASDDCSKIKYEDVVSFLTKYYYPTLGFSSSQDEAGKEMMQSYAIASSLTLRSQVCLSQALNLKKLTDKLKKEQALVSSGVTMSKNQLKKQRKLSSEADAKIRKAAEKQKNLTPQQRENFTLGTASYLAGVYATAQLFKKIQAYAKETGAEVSGLGSSKKRFGLSAMKDLKDVVGSYGTLNAIKVITKGLKPHVSSLLTTSRFLMDYSKKQNVKLPSDATQSIGSAIEWV